MIALSFTIISAALDIVTLMLLRLLLKLVIGNGVAYFSLSNLILLFFYFAFAFFLYTVKIAAVEGLCVTIK